LLPWAAGGEKATVESNRPIATALTGLVGTLRV